MSEIENKKSLPPIPEKLYFTIGETSKLCLLEPHVLRYWEREFSCLSPVKRLGRRYYQAAEILLIRRLKKLLYEDGYTIEGAKTLLTKEGGNNNLREHSSQELVGLMLARLESLLSELEESSDLENGA